jgi:hypothetical protein
MPIAPRHQPNIDIAGSIGGLGDALIGGLEYGQKRKIDRATRAALAGGLGTGPGGGPDYMTAAARILQGGGDVETALTLARLAEVQERTNWERNQPDWQVINGSLYNLRDLGGQGGGQQGGGQPAGPTGPAPAYPEYPEEPSSGQPDYPPDVPQPQTAQAPTGPRPVIQGQPEPPKTTTIYVNGQPQVMQFNPATGAYDIPLGGQKAPPSPKSRSLSATAVNDLIEAGQNAQDINRLHETWNDSYGGYGVGGEVANVAGKRIPGSKYADQARWWQDYQTRKNDLRHSKFGASLTPGEKAEFAKADIDPNMDSAVIKTNLDRQQKILTSAAKRLAKVWIKQGYDADAIAEAVGYSPEDLGIQAPAEEGTAVPGSTENAASALPPGWTQEEWDVLTPEEQQSISQ